MAAVEESGLERSKGGEIGKDLVGDKVVHGTNKVICTREITVEKSE